MVQAYVIVDRCSSMLMLGSNFSCFLTQTKMLFTINETEGLLWRGDGSEGERERVCRLIKQDSLNVDVRR